MPFLLSDTVGFIRKLPHHLVESFKSTLDEVRESDILLHVVDLSHPQYEDQINTVNKTLQELGVIEHPTVMVFNKIDQYRSSYFDDLLDQETKAELEQELLDNLRSEYEGKGVVMISALKKENMDLMRAEIGERVKVLYEKRYPYKTPFYS
jgi:GTP-binding protein HflX